MISAQSRARARAYSSSRWAEREAACRRGSVEIAEPVDQRRRRQVRDRRLKRDNTNEQVRRLPGDKTQIMRPRARHGDGDRRVGLDYLLPEPAALDVGRASLSRLRSKQLSAHLRHLLGCDPRIGEPVLELARRQLQWLVGCSSILERVFGGRPRRCLRLRRMTPAASRSAPPRPCPASVSLRHLVPTPPAACRFPR